MHAKSAYSIDYQTRGVRRGRWSPSWPAIFVSLERAGETAAALDCWLMDKALLAKAKQAACALAEKRFNWDLEKRVFLEVVSSVFAAS